jgi:hypothetical protein
MQCQNCAVSDVAFKSVNKYEIVGFHYLILNLKNQPLTCSAFNWMFLLQCRALRPTK